MLYSILIIALAGAAFELGNARRRHIFKARAQALSKPTPEGQSYADRAALSDVPEAVARYLKSALPDNFAIISMARLRHNGYFRTGLDKEWEKIKGEQYISGILPGFACKGQTKLFTAIDSFVAGKGNLSGWLFSALRIINKCGSQTDDAEIIRWIAESALLPSNLLPSHSLKWEAVDRDTTKLHYTFTDKVFSLLVNFNTHNEIETVETRRLFNSKELQKWKGRFGSYKRIEGYKIPTKLEAAWIIDGIEKPYARFRITQINFNCNGLCST